MFPATPFDRYYLENAAPVRIFSPELLSVTGNDTHIEMQKTKTEKHISAYYRKIQIRTGKYVS